MGRRHKGTTSPPKMSSYSTTLGLNAAMYVGHAGTDSPPYILFTTYATIDRLHLYVLALFAYLSSTYAILFWPRPTVYFPSQPSAFSRSAFRCDRDHDRDRDRQPVTPAEQAFTRTCVHTQEGCKLVGAMRDAKSWEVGSGAAATAAACLRLLSRCHPTETNGAPREMPHMRMYMQYPACSWSRRNIKHLCHMRNRAEKHVNLPRK